MELTLAARDATALRTIIIMWIANPGGIYDFTLYLRVYAEKKNAEPRRLEKPY